MCNSLAPCETACNAAPCRPTSVSALMSFMKLIVCKVMTNPSLSGVCLRAFILSGIGLVSKFISFFITKSYFFTRKKSLRTLTRTTERMPLAI